MLYFTSTYWHRFLGITCVSASVFWVSSSQANITPDSTLPNNSDVNLQGNTTLIEGGTKSGGNLFHSFKEFSVPTGAQAHFNNSIDINNIITRVTGGSISNIDGLIRANGAANLFLINPAGIVFGENARLDIGGSFLGTTADALAFDENNFFSASNPQNNSSLLQINPNALFFNQLNSQASIENNSIADVGLGNILGTRIDPSFFTSSGLRVADGKSLLLVGGNVTINGGGLTALGGRVELGGLAGTGRVGLNGDGDNLSLSFPSGVERSDVAIGNSAGVRVAADDGGSIAINARNLEITDESFLFAGIENGLGTEQSRAGNIDINATGGIRLDDISFIKNYVLPGAKGQGGDIDISSKTLQVEGGAEISTRTFAAGNGGKLTVQAEGIFLFGTNASSSIPSTGGSLFTGAETNSSGNGGDLTVKTNDLTLIEANMGVNTSGGGDGGNLTIEAEDITLVGSTNIFSTVSSYFQSSVSGGDGGNIAIKTNNLELFGGPKIQAFTIGDGNGGNLTVEAQDIQLFGTDSQLRTFSRFRFLTDPEAQRDAGDLTIKTNNLLLQGGANVETQIVGNGEGGNLIIEAEDIQLIDSSNFRITTSIATAENVGSLNIKTNTLLLQNDSKIATTRNSSSFLKAGDINIEAQDIQLIDSSLNTNSSGRKADAGDLNIKTNTLLLQDGAQINTTAVLGKPGKLTINAEDIQLIGLNTRFRSTILGAMEPGDVQAGDIKITTNTLLIKDGAQILSEGIFGDGGDISIKTNTLLLQDGGQVNANTLNIGKGGNIKVEAEDIQLIGESKDGSPSGLFIISDPDSTGDAGESLDIKTNTLLVKDGAEISASTFGEGAGGKITINAQNVQLIGFDDSPSGLFTTAQKNSTGDGGDLSVNSNILKVENGAQISAEGLSTGRAGNLFINADSIRLNNKAQLNASTRSNKVDSETEQATINITSKDLIMRRGSNIFTNAQGENVIGGNININTDILAALENSDISANSENFLGGKVVIEAQGIFGTQFRPQLTPKSDITATGADNIENSSGIVEIITPNIDLNSGLITLATIPVETEVAQGCDAGSSIAQSRFEIIGRGGLPHLPTDALSADAVQVDLVTLKPEVNKPAATNVYIKPQTSTPKKIVEATGWIQNKKGEIFFVADAANGRQVENLYKNNHCGGS